MLERLQVRARQLPVIVNTAIAPCPWCLPVAGSLPELIGPVDAAGVTVVLGRLVWLVEPELVEADPVAPVAPGEPAEPVEPVVPVAPLVLELPVVLVPVPPLLDVVEPVVLGEVVPDAGAEPDGPVTEVGEGTPVTDVPEVPVVEGVDAGSGVVLEPAVPAGLVSPLAPPEIPYR